MTSVSAGVLQALADALGLSTDAREYLVTIAADAGAEGSRPATYRVRPQTQQLGEITLDSQQLRMDDEPDQYVVAYTARPGTADEEALRFLSAWAASPKQSSPVESDSLS